MLFRRCCTCVCLCLHRCLILGQREIPRSRITARGIRLCFRPSLVRIHPCPCPVLSSRAHQLSQAASTTTSLALLFFSSFPKNKRSLASLRRCFNTLNIFRAFTSPHPAQQQSCCILHVGAANVAGHPKQAPSSIHPIHYSAGCYIRQDRPATRTRSPELYVG